MSQLRPGQDKCVTARRPLTQVSWSAVLGLVSFRTQSHEERVGDKLLNQQALTAGATPARHVLPVWVHRTTQRRASFELVREVLGSTRLTPTCSVA